jgi:3-isopropylmalate/(R)-2-methylmalate dehydratase large subunit
MSFPATISEKILARAAGKSRVQAGEIITAKVDLAMMHDSGGPRRVASKLRELGAAIWDKDRVVVVSDHYVPAVDADSAAILHFTRGWVAEQGIRHFYDMRGICHVVLPEHGHLMPGLFAVGGDSHSPSAGAYGAFMIGIGATEMAGVLATGEIWLRVPQTTRIQLQGQRGEFVCAKDIMLHLCGRLGLGNDYQVMEFTGAPLANLDMHERLVLCNMTAELGAKTGIIAPDSLTQKALSANAVQPAQTLGFAMPADGPINWASDQDAQVLRAVEVDLNKLTPQVAAPHSPANSDAVSAFHGVRVDQAYIGACTGAKLSDLHMAASVLRGRSVRNGTRLLIAPASLKTYQTASADGTLAILTAAGAIMLSSGCGACAGMGAGLLAADEVCISSTARNFKGRMGAASAKVYLASPYTVAAAAIAGEIIDPRELTTRAFA